MDYKDALSCIDNVLNADVHYDESLEYQLTTDDTEWLETSKAAIKKQFPQKPTFVMSSFSEELGEIKHGHCPVCNRISLNFDKFCGECGQALEWGQP